MAISSQLAKQETEWSAHSSDKILCMLSYQLHEESLILQSLHASRFQDLQEASGLSEERYRGTGIMPRPPLTFGTRKKTIKQKQPVICCAKWGIDREKWSLTALYLTFAYIVRHADLCQTLSCLNLLGHAVLHDLIDLSANSLYLVIPMLQLLVICVKVDQIIHLVYGALPKIGHCQF